MRAKQLAKIMKALSNENRLKLYLEIAKHEESDFEAQECNLSDLVKTFGLSPAHWGTFNLGMQAWTEPAERVLVAAEKVGVATAVPRPGASIEPGPPTLHTRWWPSVPWNTAEQAPIVSSGVEPPQRPASHPNTHGGESR